MSDSGGERAALVSRGATDFDLDMIETRTLEDKLQELIYRPLHG